MGDVFVPVILELSVRGKDYLAQFGLLFSSDSRSVFFRFVCLFFFVRVLRAFILNSVWEGLSCSVLIAYRF